MKLPNWMSRQFNKAKCSHCGEKLNPKGVTTHGITEEKVKKSLILYHFYQYMCSKCNSETRFKFPTDWPDFIDSIVDVAESEMMLPPQPEEKSSFIGDDEVEELKEMLDNSEYFEDFLNQIGVKPTDYQDENDKNQ